MSLGWAAVKELEISYYVKEALFFFTMYPYSGNFVEIPSQQPAMMNS